MSYDFGRLMELGISWQDAKALRRIAMTLHRWHELGCGVDGGGLDQDEITGKFWWYSSRTGERTHIVPDRERGAQRRLAKVMANYPTLLAYVQGDPRGASLYILPPNISEDNYNRGVAVHK